MKIGKLEDFISVEETPSPSEVCNLPKCILNGVG